METLKSRYRVVVDKRKYGGKSVSVSINRLDAHIPLQRAEKILKSVLSRTDFPARFSVQNTALVRVYLK